MTHGRAHKTSGRLADQEEPIIDKFALAKLSAKKTYFKDANNLKCMKPLQVVYICCMYVCIYVHTYLKEKKSHLIAPLVMYHSWFQSWGKKKPYFTQHSTLRKSLHPSHHFLGLIILYLSIAQPSNAANDPQTCLIISLRVGAFSLPHEGKPKNKKK